MSFLSLWYITNSFHHRFCVMIEMDVLSRCESTPVVSRFQVKFRQKRISHISKFVLIFFYYFSFTVGQFSFLFIVFFDTLYYPVIYSEVCVNFLFFLFHYRLVFLSFHNFFFYAEAATGGVLWKIKKETLVQVFSCEFCENFLEHLFYRTLPDCYLCLYLLLSRHLSWWFIN